MVRRPGKSLLTWLLAVMVGGLSLLGEELHDLLGLHQGPVVSDSHLLGFSTGCYSRNGNAHTAAANHRESCHDALTCPICQYLALGRVIGERVEVDFGCGKRTEPIARQFRSSCQVPFSSHSRQERLRLSSLSALIWRSVIDLAHC